MTQIFIYIHCVNLWELRGAIAVFVIVGILLLFASAYNYINLTGVMNFTDIFNGTAETLLFTQLSFDVAYSFPVKYQYDIQQGLYYTFFIGFIAGWVYAIYKALTS